MYRTTCRDTVSESPSPVGTRHQATHGSTAETGPGAQVILRVPPFRYLQAILMGKASAYAQADTFHGAATGSSCGGTQLLSTFLSRPLLACSTRYFCRPENFARSIQTNSSRKTCLWLTSDLRCPSFISFRIRPSRRIIRFTSKIFQGHCITPFLPLYYSPPQIFKYASSLRVR